MPKLDGTHIAERLKERIAKLKNGEEVAARDLRALLTDEQTAALDAAKKAQQELKKAKRARTKEEEKALGVEWHPKLSHFEENLHPNLSHPTRLSCLIFEQGWARSDQRGNFEQITQTCPSRQGLHPAS